MIEVAINKLSQQNDQDQVVRTVTVMEHNSVFGNRLLNKNASQSSTPVNMPEPTAVASNKESQKDNSEKSRPLSPLTSQRMSPKDNVFDYKARDNDEVSKDSKSKKNTVKFKEEEYGQDEEELPPSKEPIRLSDKIMHVGNPSDDQLSNQSKRKVSSILKNKSEASNSYNSKGELNAAILNQRLNSTDEQSDGKSNKYSDKNEKSSQNYEQIPNMRVEEDQVNLSDLGQGPEKPTIKTIYTKYKQAQNKSRTSSEAEPQPSPVQSKPSPKPNSTTKQSSKSVPKQNSSNDKNSNDSDSEMSEIIDDSKDPEYIMRSKLFTFSELKSNPNYIVK